MNDTLTGDKNAPCEILVAGFVNVETQVRVESFPVEYAKSRFVFHGTGDNVSGVALNVSAALKTLGHEVRVATVLADDLMGGVVAAELTRRGLHDPAFVRRDDQAPTARTVVLTGPGGADAMFTDLKNHQEYSWPEATVRQLVGNARIVHATNVNWGLQFARAAREAGCLVSTDVHAISTWEDAYNRRFLELADIVFLSGERLASSPQDMATDIFARFPARLIVIGLGASGAVIAERDRPTLHHLPATPLREVIGATGAGDAMAAAFLSCHLRGMEPQESLRRAQLFAGWKIGELGGSRGHLTRARLDELAGG